MNVMKTTVRVMTAALIAVSMQAAAARKGGSARTADTHKAADSVVIYRTDTVYINNVADEDGNVSELAQITNQYQLEAYKAKLMEESKQNSSEKDLQAHRSQIEDESYENRQYFNLFSSYFSLLMFGLGLPCLVVFIYLHYMKNRQHRYEMLTDMMRSGVEVKPEVLEALSLSRSKINWSAFSVKPGKAMAADNYFYCVKRVAWALACLIIGLAFASISHTGEMFGFGVIVAALFFMQAAVRYFSQAYISKNSEYNQNSENNQTPTPDNNAQQP